MAGRVALVVTAVCHPAPRKWGNPFLPRAETQRRREVFGGGGWTRLTGGKSFLATKSTKSHKGRKVFKCRDATSPERATVYSREWSEAEPPGGHKTNQALKGRQRGTFLRQD